MTDKQIEVEDFETFMTSSELGEIKFSEITGANILKKENKQNDKDSIWFIYCAV